MDLYDRVNLTLLVRWDALEIHGGLFYVSISEPRENSPELGGRGMKLPGVTVEVTQIAALLKEQVCNSAVLHDTRP